MASPWWLFGRSASSSSSSTPTVSNLLHLSKTNVQRISELTSPTSQKEFLNPNQCRSLSWKMVKVMQNIEGLVSLGGHLPIAALGEQSPIAALEDFYRVCEKAKELVENCCSEDWCQASTFQIQNEEAFKEILLQTSLCYNTIYELVDGFNFGGLLLEDLRFSSTFEPPSWDEVLQDQIILIKRYKDFIDDTNVSSSSNQKLYLAKHLSRRLDHIHLQLNIEDLDVSTSSLWPDGKSPDGEWGKESIFLGGNVCKTTWLDVPCAKKVFNDGVREDVILAEAKILARLNHPNIVKFICCGHDQENTWHFIAMEQMERGLHSVIRKQAQLKKGAPFPLLSAVDIMLQIAHGMRYLHENGIAHRDLKTCNVVVRQIIAPYLQDYLQVKLVDFGLSKVKLTASRSNTISYPRIGTTVYMPPEAFQHGRANWLKADVYCFGIMCSVILSGKEPFQEIQRNKVYEAICHGERPMLPLETPDELTWLIKKCWDTDRRLRPDFAEICTSLAKLRHKLLKEDPLDCGRSFKDGYEMDNFASIYIQEMIKKQSDARKQDCSNVHSQLLENVIEEEDWFVPEQEIDIKEQPREPKMSSSHIASTSSSYIAQPGQVRNQASSGGFVDTRARPGISAPESTDAIPSPAHPGMQAGESEEPTSPGGSSPLWVQPGDLIGLKRRLVQLLTQNGGKMMLSKVRAEYNKLFGRPLYLAEYNAQSYVHLIDKMKDTLFIKGDGMSKTLHLITRIEGFHFPFNHMNTVVEFSVPQCCTTDCEAKIKNHLFNIPGVDKVIVDYLNQKVTVTGIARVDKILREIKKVKKRARLLVPKQDGQLLQ